MNSYDDNEIRFIGKITASITHEIKNVLASIKELTGLMEDLVLMSDDFPLKEKLQKTIPRISAQVDRGSEITMNFNAFAHIPDAKIDNLDIKAVAMHIAYLSKRIAHQKNIELIVPDENVSAEIRVNPLHLYMGIFSVLEFLINRMNNDGAVKIVTEKKEGMVNVILICEGELTDRDNFLSELKSSDEWSGVNVIAGLTGGTVKFDEADNIFEIRLANG